MAEIDIKIVMDTANAANSVKDIKQSIKDLNNAALAVGEGGKGFSDLTKKAGELKNKMGDLNAQTNALNGSGVEKLTASMGILKEAFTTANPEKLSAGFKVMGAAMKAIPIFLIIEGIKYLIDNFEKLKNSGGFLGKVFTAIGDVISWLIQQFKDLTDWLGLTNNAIEDNAAKTIEAAKKIQSAQESRFNDEIALAKAAGKNTEELEKKKQLAVIESVKAQLMAIKSVVAVTGAISEEQQKQIDELMKTAHDAQLAIAVGTLSTNKKVQDDLDKQSQEYSDKRKVAREKELENIVEQQKKIFGEAVSATDKLFDYNEAQQRKQELSDKENLLEREDLKTKFKQQDLEKEKQQVLRLDALALETENKRKLLSIKELKELEDAEKKKGIKHVEYLSQETSIELAYSDKSDEIVKQGEDEKQKLKDAAWKESYEAYKKALEGEAALQKDANKKAVQGEEKSFEERINNAIKFTDKYVKLQESLFNDVQQILTALSSLYAAQNETKLNDLNNSYTLQNEALTEANAVELDAINQLEHDKTITKEEADNRRYELDVKARKAKYALDLAEYNSNNAIKKKAFESDQKMKIATTVINTITGSIAALTGMISAIPGPVGIVAGALAAAAVIAAGAIQIAAIKAQKFDEGTPPAAPHFSPNLSGGGGVESGVSTPNNMALFGTAGKNNNLGPGGANGGSDEGNDGKMMKVYVLESDITASQRRVGAYVSDSSI